MASRSGATPVSSATRTNDFLALLSAPPHRTDLTVLGEAGLPADGRL
jgi:hypothetical protein